MGAVCAIPKPLPSDVVGRSPIDLNGVLDRLLIATAADAAEIFLSTPTGDEVVLAAHRGRAPRAFRQVVRFPLGLGLPGLVARSGEPILSLDLPHDDRFLRPLVKRQGFRSYACIPLVGDSGLVGTMHTAYRHGHEAVVSQLPFLQQVAHELTRSLEMERLRVARAIGAFLFDSNLDAVTNLQAAARQGLRALMAASAADRGLVLLLDERSALLEPVAEWPEMPPRLHRLLAHGCAADKCPGFADGRCRLLSRGGEQDPTLCRTVLRNLAGTATLPLVAGGQKIGVALLGYRRAVSAPGRHLALLHPAADALAAQLHNAQVAVRQEHRARRAAWLAGDRQASALGYADSGATEGDAKPPAGPAADTPHLDLHCLGPFAILVNGRPIPPERFKRKRSLTLLRILVTRYGKQVHREELMELLWPEGNPKVTRGLLAVAIHYLRRGLEPDAAPGRPSSFIRRNGEHYYFDTRSPHRIDTVEFLEAARLAASLDKAGKSAEALSAYRRAISLYGGDYLEEERYSDWCAAERDHLRQRYLTLLMRAGRLHLAAGDGDAAVNALQRALQIDPTLEEVHRALIEALWRAGRRGEALAQYRQCRDTAERRLGVTLSSETQALGRQIAAGPPSAQA